MVTELSNPWPNYHATEPILLTALYGAFQDWDGLLLYAYRGDEEWRDRDYVAVKYDFDRHMTKLVAITVASLLFRRNDISAGGDPLKVKTTRKDVQEEAWNNQNMRFSNVTHALGTHWITGFDPPEGYLPGYATLMRRIEIDKDETHSVADPPDPPGDNIFKTETEEIEWHYDPENIDDSFVKVDTDNVHVLAGAIDTGHVEIHNFSHGVLAGGSIEVDPPLEDSALIAMILRDISPNGTKTYLIIAAGIMENTEFYPTQESAGPPAMYYLDEPEHWGHAPVMVEGINAYFILPFPAENVEWYALDPEGNHGVNPLPVDELENYSGLRLSEDNQTLWYKVVIHS